MLPQIPISLATALGMSRCEPGETSFCTFERLLPGGARKRNVPEIAHYRYVSERSVSAYVDAGHESAG
jgi:hypothetical protein